MKTDLLRESVTARIITLLESGVKPWAPTWDGAPLIERPLRQNGKPYRGINVLILWISAMEFGLSSPYWMTFNQAVEQGGKVIKGEKGTAVLAYKPADPAAEDAEQRGRAFARAYYVFNASQIEGLDDRYYPAAHAADRSARCSTPLQAYTLMMDHHQPTYLPVSGRAFYHPTDDSVHWPAVGEFTSADDHFITACHELAHWSGASHRLDREGITQPYDKMRYAREELVAEIAAAMIGANVGLRGDHLEDHASYIGSWLSLLKDPAEIFRAASQAERAAEWTFSETLVSILHARSIPAVNAA